jgi:hypothetical protein
MDELLLPVFLLSLVVVPLLALALVLYAVPVRASVRLVTGENHTEETIVISWSGAGIRTSHRDTGIVIELLLADRAVFAHTVTTTAGKEEEKAMPDQPVADRPVVSADTFDPGEIVHRVQALMEPAGTFGSAFWRECRFEEARGRVTLGLGDPVLTGECCGLYWASRFVLEASRIYLELEPVFDRQILELDITAKMKVRHPLLVLIALCRLAIHPALRDAFATVKRQSRGVPAS